jgi:alpha-beta hydrolase superfamily lysophospholipase
VLSSVLAPEGQGFVDGSFISRDGLNLSTWRIGGSQSPLGPVILIHGLSDHSRSMPYRRLALFLAARGFGVFAFDRRGSGRSEGSANYATNWEELREDLTRFVDMVEDQCGRLPSLIGLSFGGLQALDFALDAPESVHVCVVMAPALDLSGTSPWLRRLLPILARFRPGLELDPGLDDRDLVRDPAVGRAYRDDPQWRPRTTPAFAVAAIEALERIHARAAKFTTPLLVLHGTADRVVPIGGTRSVFPRLGSKDKTLLEMPGAFHALPIDFEDDQVGVLIADWLKDRRVPALTSLAAGE